MQSAVICRLILLASTQIRRGFFPPNNQGQWVDVRRKWFFQDVVFKHDLYLIIYFWFLKANGIGLELALVGMLPSILKSYSNLVHFPGRFIRCCWYLINKLHKSSCCCGDKLLLSHILPRNLLCSYHPIISHYMSCVQSLFCMLCVDSISFRTIRCRT